MKLRINNDILIVIELTNMLRKESRSKSPLPYEANK